MSRKLLPNASIQRGFKDLLEKEVKDDNEDLDLEFEEADEMDLAKGKINVGLADPSITIH